MGTGNGVENYADVRGAEIVQHSTEVGDLGLGGALRAYFRVYLPIILVVLLLAGTLAGTLIFREAAEWAPLRFGMIVAALGLGFCGFIYDAKRLRSVVRPYAPDVLQLLDSRERRTIRREIMRGTARDGAQLVVARACAVQIRKQAATQLITVVPMLTLIILGQTLPAFGSYWVLNLIGAVFVVIAAGLAVRQFLLTGRFLRQTA